MNAAVRFPVSFLLALGFTSAVFWFLSTLINMKVEHVEQQKAMRIEFSRVRRDTEAKTIKRQKPEPEKPIQAMASTSKVPTESGVSGFEPSAGPIAIGLGSGVTVDVKGILGGPMAVSAGGSDREEMPLVRVEPVYPPRALARGVEGWVLVEFTITAAGTTADVRAVKADPERVFDAAAVKAVESWKYNPRVEAGMATDRRGVQVLISFAIAE